jgi:Fe-S-cluster containining protein
LRKIIDDLEYLYSIIPKFNCNHCHKCCGPIIWFEPEEIMIRNYLKKNNMKKIVWTKNKFKENKMLCPYLKNDRCSIYPVRPIVCRLQGNIAELRCKSNNNTNKNQISKNELNEIRKKFINLIKQTNRVNNFYSTLLLDNDRYESKNWK